jgi:hypothetical protein
MTLKCPVTATGLFFTVVLTRTSPTLLSITVTDHMGILINNQTNNQVAIDAGGTTIDEYANPFGLCISSERATPECFDCGLLDVYPDTLGTPRGWYWASSGPRTNGGGLVTQYMDYMWVFGNSSTSYTSGGYALARAPQSQISSHLLSFTGAYVVAPIEVSFDLGYLQGRKNQALMVDSGLVNAATIVVPIDVGVTGTFKVVGFTAGSTPLASCKTAYRTA